VIVSPSLMDTPWRVAGTLGTAFYRNIGFTLLIQYLRTYSSGSNYSLQDFIVAAGPTFHFRPLGHP
jgi:hypothetical protein